MHQPIEKFRAVEPPGFIKGRCGRGVKDDDLGLGLIGEAALEGETVGDTVALAGRLKVGDSEESETFVDVAERLAAVLPEVLPERDVEPCLEIEREPLRGTDIEREPLRVTDPARD